MKTTPANTAAQNTRSNAHAVQLQGGGQQLAPPDYSGKTQEPGLLDAADTDVVQRVISIGGGRPITHASARLNDLYNQVVLPWLDEKGYKQYGIKSQLVSYVRENNADFENPAHFIHVFGGWLTTRTRPVRGGGKETPVLKQFSPKKMARPVWPDGLREKLGFQKGDNIRHVVRNATLLRAITIEYEKFAVRSPEQLARMREIAAGVGIDGDEVPLQEIVNRIYHRVYLNESNLFAGQGPFNQIIGYAADGMQRLGNNLLAEEEDATVNPQAIKGLVADVIADAAGRLRGVAGVAAELQGIVNSLLEVYMQHDQVPAEEIGGFILDMGINLGFDLIDGRVAADQENIAARQGGLIRCETALQDFIRSGGANGNLAEIFRDFVAIARG